MFTSIFFLTITMTENQSQEEIETEITSKTHSKIWSHFKLVNEKAKCLYCG